MEWVKVLEIPALILAGAVIWMLFNVVKVMMLELTAYNRTLTKMAVVLDIICRRVGGTGSGREGGK